MLVRMQLLEQIVIYKHLEVVLEVVLLLLLQVLPRFLTWKHLKIGAKVLILMVKMMQITIITVVVGEEYVQDPVDRLEIMLHFADKALALAAASGAS